MSKKVDFIICGTQKSGTTALDVYLRQHPEICMANIKEVHFFDNEQIFSSAAPDYAYYHSFFNPQSSHKLLGETTPIYMYWPDAARRISQYNPNIKLIVLLRNPIDRAYSQWNMERLKNTETLSFWEAIQSEKERCQEALPYQHRTYSYIDRGRYLQQLERLWTYFPTSQVLILKHEELKQNPTQTLDLVYDFLEIGHFHQTEALNLHALPYAAPMGKREKAYLKSVFESEIQGLERVLNWDCSNWLAV
ncbi:MAG: sulfotransferase domain-containing protein [Methylophilaceae bacterium]